MATPLSGTDTQVPNTSPLLSFADTINQAVQLARQKRNAGAVSLMAPFQGVATAGDFGSILSKMNNASDSTASDLIKTATKLDQPKYELREIDGSLYQIETDANGKAIGSPTLVKGGSGGSGTLIKSGALSYSKDDYAGDSTELEQSRGQDGWVDPSVYLSLFNAWKHKGGELADFIKQFPPKMYVNPANDWLPPYLRNTTGDSYSGL